jgi:SPP1 gp7 family putative phage head morphogenesis protein
MNSAAHRQTDSILNNLELEIDELFIQAQTAFLKQFDVLLIYLDEPQATPRQRIRHANRDDYYDILIALLVSMLEEAALESVATAGKAAKEVYKANYKSVSGTDDIEAKRIAEPSFKIKKLQKGIKKATEKKMETAIRQGHTPERIILDAKSAFQRWKNACKRTARTLATQYENMALFDAMKAAGATHKRWNTVADNRVRDTHKRLHGEVKLLDEKFSNGLRYPGDEKGSAEEVVNCRCYISPETPKSGVSSV